MVAVFFLPSLVNQTTPTAAFIYFGDKHAERVWPTVLNPCACNRPIYIRRNHVITMDDVVSRNRKSALFTYSCNVFAIFIPARTRPKTLRDDVILILQSDWCSKICVHGFKTV